jgi:Methyltransferase domain.
MVEIATANADNERVSDRVGFEQADITSLSHLNDGEADLTCFTFGAHHMPDLETVKNVIREMDRVTNAEGLVFLMDGVRLRSKSITDQYMKSVGYNFVELGLYRIFEDLRNSLLAAWTVEEMRTVIPSDSKRNWCQLTPFGFPISQFLVGYPPNRKSLFLRTAKAENNPLIRELLPKWEIQVGKSWTQETRQIWRISHALLFSSLGYRAFA